MLPAVDADASVVWLAPDAGLPTLASGYELYAWQKDGELRFSFISFRDRAKTLDEIAGELPDHQNGDWVRVQGQGFAALEQTLARIPARSSVILESMPSLPAPSTDTQEAIVRLLLARGADGGSAARDIEKLCTSSGGRVDSSYCCMSSQPFPDTCSIGACGCAPEHSKLTSYCVCDEGRCFDRDEGCKLRSVR